MDAVRTSLVNGMSSKALITGTLIFVASVALASLLAVRKDPQEPPHAPPGVPLIGHLIRMYREGADYYIRLSKRYPQGIFTLPVLTGRIYIVSSPDWAQAVHKAHKSLSFHALVVPAMRKVFCFDEPTMKVCEDNMNDEKGDRSGIMNETHDMIFKVLAPGKDLDDLNGSFLNELAPHFDNLASHGDPEKIKLWHWLRHHFSLASATSIYGPRNPFVLHPELVADFWEFEAGIMSFFTTPFPSIFARKPYLARQRLFAGMIEYAEKGDFKHASVLAKNRAAINLGQYAFSPSMYGMGETSMLFAILTNTVPSAFWLMGHIFADAQLLAEVRAEIDLCIRTDEGSKRIINATKMKSQCPLFFSAFRETLRMRSCIDIDRYILEDTLVTNPKRGEAYLLKKGSMLQVAANVIHSQPGIYGEDADSYNPRRFLRTAGNSTDPAAAFRDGSGKVHGGSFRTFGGGNNICPGRHFAQTEMQALAALFVVGFEVEGADGGLYMPPAARSPGQAIANGVQRPANDVDVTVRRRIGYEDVRWAFEM